MKELIIETLNTTNKTYLEYRLKRLLGWVEVLQPNKLIDLKILMFNDAMSGLREVHKYKQKHNIALFYETLHDNCFHHDTTDPLSEKWLYMGQLLEQYYTKGHYKTLYTATESLITHFYKAL